MLFDSPFKSLPSNVDGRDFCIGDLHGCLDMLNKLLTHVGFDRGRDRLFAVGDLVHRGPSSVGCLQLAEQPWFYTVMGNHEAMQLGAYRRAINTKGKQLHSLCEYSGPDDTLLPGHPDQPQMEHILEHLPLALEFSLPDGRKVGIVHAGLPNEHTWADIRAMATHERALFEEDGHLQRRILWDRLPVMAASTAAVPGIGKNLHMLFPAAIRYQHFLATQPIEGLDLLVSGHTTLASRRPLTTGTRLYLDTGAGQADGCLTMIELASGRYWQVFDPSTDPDMLVTEYPNIPMSDQNLVWVTESEQQTMEAMERASRLREC